MALIAQAVHSPHLGAPCDAFSIGAQDPSKHKYNAHSNDSSAARQWLEAQQKSSSSQQADDGQSFFDFEPSVQSASPFAPQYPSLPDADLTPGWNTIAFQIPSPPNSATTPPPSWPPFQYQQPPPVHNILTDIYPDTKVQYGQNTPPDEEFYNLFSNEQLHNPNGTDGQSLPATEGKRKRSSTSNESKASPAKRPRKYGRSVGSSNAQLMSSAEEVRRHKFLERNRIAASKCRQKKKEWTQNLENRARELQKNNQSLRMVLDSLRDEMLFLKGEMLKHTTCGCEQIRGWVKTKAGSLDQSPIIKTEHSPINSAPSSRRGSVSSHSQEATSPEQEAVQRSSSPETQKLEGLLLDQLVHDTSDRGIASTLQAAA
ncbi:MAG: hypothetical protein LQ338_003245 [Usnochroma carphineum]|nr:MAG: hypothetical protein LQ338_003245 [Usnochroma carphineum]